MTTEEDFWAKVDKGGGPDACWPWTGRKTTNGYGQTVYFGRLYQAHRLAWILTNEAIPDGLLACHHCDNKPCCNPKHLHIGTQLDNMADRKARGREARGDRHWTRLHPELVARGAAAGQAKLDADKVRHIRAARAAGAQVKDLAAMYGVSGPAISYAVSGKSWRHV